MCEFISWIEYRGRNYFLTKRELATRDGQKLLREIGQDEITGHGAIREYYGLEPSWGVNRECTNFKTPNNFPLEIVSAIKEGMFEGLGIALDIFNDSAWAEYEEKRQPAWAKYEEKRQPAWAEYQRVKQRALDEYEKVEQLARAKYDKVEQLAWAEYQRAKQTAFWELAVKKENRVKKWR